MLCTRYFGKASNGEDVHLYLLSNAAGAWVGVTDLGAYLVSCRVPDGRGSFPDVLLGYDGVAGYISDGYSLGAVVGRCANRIAGAHFVLEGTSYQLAANSGAHNLHSGPAKWSDRLWTVIDKRDDAISFELISPEGDQGFPGSIRAQVRYQLSEDNQLSLHYVAQPSEATIINLTNHAYWNLNGHAARNVLQHTLQIFAESYTPLNDHIPTGEISPVAGTPYDFREPRRLDARLDLLPEGYDDNWCLGNESRLCQAARLVGDQTGITMTVLTDAPGIQVYTADYFEVANGRDGMHYGGFAGIALETQYYPDAVHHPNFPQPVFTPERPYASTTIFAFGHSA